MSTSYGHAMKNGEYDTVDQLFGQPFQQLQSHL